MEFKEHFALKDKHAFLSASKYYWVNYDVDKLKTVYFSEMAKLKGTKLHHIAQELIESGINLPKRNHTLNMYVNDAIGYSMTPEQVLYYSDFCFGTADAISFREDKKLLRIHDLKTGKTPAHMEQLVIYAALFCLEYHINPCDIRIELRIYQNDEIFVHKPSGEEVKEVSEKIIEFDKVLEEMNRGEHNGL